MSELVTIVGLDQVGSSIGLALGALGNAYYRTGYDRDVKVGQQAVKEHVIDKSAFNLPGAIEKADYAFLSVPAFELKPALEIIGPVLKEGAILVDTSPLKKPAEDWAAQFVPAGRWFVSISPTLNPLSFTETKPSADLFRNSLAVITAGKGTPESVVDEVIELVESLGAKTQFSDALEHDGLIAGARQLPEILAAGLYHAVADQPGWTENRKLAGAAFANASAPLQAFAGHEAPAEALFQNRDNAIRVLDNLIVALNDLRDDLAAEKHKEVHEFFAKAASGRQLWNEQRQRAEWERRVDTPEPPDLLGRRLFGRAGKAEKK